MKLKSKHRQSKALHIDELYEDVKPTKPIIGSSNSVMTLMQLRYFGT